jgi:branched-chain amino acid transport system ATP-binding protein
MNEAILRTRALSRHFGGLAAVSDVSLACEMGQVHAVIGPNGAGKSTLINVLSGDLPASAGQVLFDGRDITRLAAERISQLGIARSYQKTNLFLPFTAFENCRLAAQSRLSSSMHFVRPALGREDINAAAQRSLAQAGLAGRGDVIVCALSHGEQRQVEIAMALATRPRVLLLDEPLAGMGAEESSRIVELLRELARDHAILLVEHDMDAVFAVANTLTVMVNGRVLESGSPAQIRASRAVQEAYLGVDGA